MSVLKSPEKAIWYSMISRCYNEKQPRYKDYGARGISVCAEWRNSFSAFIKDMGLRPGKQYSIDRRDNNGNYEPGNCRWATRHTQNANRGNYNAKYPGVNLIAYSGKWSARLQIDYKLVLLKQFDLFEDAVAARKAAETKYHIYD